MSAPMTVPVPGTASPRMPAAPSILRAARVLRPRPRRLAAGLVRRPDRRRGHARAGACTPSSAASAPTPSWPSRRPALPNPWVLENYQRVLTSAELLAVRAELDGHRGGDHRGRGRLRPDGGLPAGAVPVPLARAAVPGVRARAAVPGDRRDHPVVHHHHPAAAPREHLVGGGPAAGRLRAAGDDHHPAAVPDGDPRTSSRRPPSSTAPRASRSSGGSSSRSPARAS